MPCCPGEKYSSWWFAYVDGKDTDIHPGITSARRLPDPGKNTSEFVSTRCRSRSGNGDAGSLPSLRDMGSEGGWGGEK